MTRCLTEVWKCGQLVIGIDSGEFTICIPGYEKLMLKRKKKQKNMLLSECNTFAETGIYINRLFLCFTHNHDSCAQKNYVDLLISPPSPNWEQFSMKTELWVTQLVFPSSYFLCHLQFHVKNAFNLSIYFLAFAFQMFVFSLNEVIITEVQELDHTLSLANHTTRVFLTQHLCHFIQSPFFSY